MKNSQNGSVIIYVIVAVVLIGLGVYMYLPTYNEMIVNKSRADSYREYEAAHATSTAMVETSTSTLKEVAVKSKSDMNMYAITEADILSASYKISANFNGVKTVSHNIVFPPNTSGTNDISGKVYITGKHGEEVIINPPHFSGEVFWIYGYKYTDSSRTEAKVFIGGNFGASGGDDRAFLVNKTNGMITTKETTCNRNANGLCSVDSN